MTEITFHFNVPELQTYACRFLRKAYGAGASVVVLGSAAQLAELDDALWRISATDFIPHGRSQSWGTADTPPPIVLLEALEHLPHHDLLLNLGSGLVANFEQFERVVEIVGFEPAQRDAARSRWKDYSERGHNMVRHDLAQKASA